MNMNKISTIITCVSVFVDNKELYCYLATTGDLIFFLPTLVYDKVDKDLCLGWLNWQIGVITI